MSNMNFVYENVTNKILSMLESGVSPWKKTWSASSDTPMNLVTKYPYRGVNVWMLLFSPNATTPYWATWNQIQKLNGKVKSGEEKNYEMVVFWKQLSFTKKDNNGNEIDEKFPMLRYTRVYNLGQCEFDQKVVDKLVPKKEVKENNSIEHCENIVKNYKNCPELKHGGNSAHYSPLFDRIQMPEMSTFTNAECYYSTLFHEMGHSTGSDKRLKRFKATDSNIFGSDTYSKEELVAEMTASFLCAESGIDNETIENNVAYLDGWIKAIKNGDKSMIVSAASKASQASDYILNRKKAEETETN